VGLEFRSVQVQLWRSWCSFTRYRFRAEALGAAMAIGQGQIPPQPLTDSNLHFIYSTPRSLPTGIKHDEQSYRSSGKDQRCILTRIRQIFLLGLAYWSGQGSVA
jgi:hypothetical protein